MTDPIESKLENGEETLSETRVAELIETYESESPTRALSGPLKWVVSALAILLSVYSLYWVLSIIPTQWYRVSFLLVALTLTFLLYPPARRLRQRGPGFDYLLAAVSIVALGYVLVVFEQFIYRSTEPKPLDLVLGAITILLVLEATRRTVGWILPATAVLFVAYGLWGPWLPEPFDHRGYGFDRIIGANYMTLEGIFGVPLDVAATYIILFSIYGAVLDLSGAGKFFLDFSMAAVGGSGAGPGRTVSLAGFLLGTVSGSGVATTVTLGSVSWPLLRKAGYERDRAGAILSASGIGAILSPPTLGAAAFLIAEFLKISYLQVLIMATIPTILYYLSIMLMIEAEARRIVTRPVEVAQPSILRLTLRYGYHFTSLFVVAGLMALGLTPFLAVFWATVIAFLMSFLTPETALWPRRLLQALDLGGRSVLSVAATTATAGLIVGIVTLTGLGLKIAGIIVAFAGGNLLLTTLYSAIAIWIIGLAVPVTASYILAAVMIAPAMIALGVPDVAAHMFIFYYAVLSEVSPPTALAPFAAAALTGGNPFRTMMITWKYCLPAFVVPFMFVLGPEGLGMLLVGPLDAIISSSVSAAIGVVALAAGMGGWMVRPANLPERAIATVGGLLLFYPGAFFDLAGLALFGAAVAAHLIRLRLQGVAIRSADVPSSGVRS